MAVDRPPVEIPGRRVILRRYEPADAIRLQEAIRDSVEHLRPWMPWASLEPLEVGDRERLIDGWLERWDAGDDFNFGVFEDDALVGGCGLHRRIGPDGLEISYWTRAGETGRGIATEGVRCLVEGAFSMPAIDVLEVHHDVANVASGRVPERLRFTLVTERACDVEAPAERGVERIWRLRRHDWSAAGPPS